MSIETELKLRVTPGQIARLKRHALLKTHSSARPHTRRLQNIYYDTPKLDLHRSEMALRLRHVGGKWLQTLKGGGSVYAGLHQRNEWEVPVSGAKLDFSATRAVEWDVLLRPALQKKLYPVFVTDFSRSSRMLKFQGAQIELCMDQGEMRTEQRSTPICELELELKSGAPRKLFDLAKAILEIVPFELETVNKAEQGYRLLSGYTEQPVKATAPSLSRTDTLADVLKKLIWSCVQHFQGNLHGAMASDDDEYLHQVRVALRRLRLVLRMIEKVHADRTLAALYRDASDLCIALGRIREWDVFISQTVKPICTRMVGHKGLQVLLAASERQRSKCYAALRSADKAVELQRLLLRFGIWMNGPCWKRTAWQQGSNGQSAKDFATKRLQKQSKRFARSGQHLETASAARLHSLRIIAKKLRYSAEFFSSLFDKRKAESFVGALGKVQDVLGQINDIAVAHRLLDGLTMDAALTDHHEAVVLVKGWIAHDQSGQLASLRKSISAFNKQPEFWKNK